MKSILEVDKLKYKNILNEISLSLEEGKFYLLLGSNNSGKTTFINCIRGNLDYQGTIKILNNNIKQENNHFIYKDVGLCTDQRLFFEQNVLDELKDILLGYGYEEEKAKKQIFSILKKLDITDMIFKTREELSFYEEKLLSFVISIIHNPKIIIIDDCFDSLDNKFKNKIFQYLKSKKNKTILFFTTNSDYYKLADEYLFLNDGKLVKFNSIEDLVDNEKKLIKQGIKLPFCLDLSSKLMSYELLDEIKQNMVEMVDKIWN